MQLTERFHLTDGIVEISYPSKMSDDDIRDFEDTFALMLRVIKRRNKPLQVSYDDEVTAEQVAAIDKMLAPEFEGGEWKTIESEKAQD